MAFVGGTQSFTAAMQKLKHAVNSDFPQEFRKELSRELRLLEGSLSSSAINTLPKRGGLAAMIASSDSNVRETPNGAQLSASSKHDITAMDRGRLRHPLFGNRAHWYTQAVRPGWWSIPIERSKPALQTAANRALENTKTKAGG
jgi:hypothetical protein